MLECVYGRWDTQSAEDFFSDDLTAIVGEDLARLIINYAQRPSQLEAVFLKTDEFASLEKETKNAVIDLLEHYLNS